MAAIVESILDIPVQDPPEEEFSSADLTWVKFGNPEDDQCSSHSL